MSLAKIPAADSVIALSGVWKSYGSFSVLKDVSIDLRRGQVHMLLGGKTAPASQLWLACWSGHMALIRGNSSCAGKSCRTSSLWRLGAPASTP